MIHYHGTPITPRARLLELAGRNFCVSYADPRDAATCHEIGQSVMLDNGAFSFWRQRKATDWIGYYRWCEQWLQYHTTWAVIPDVIDGDEATNDALLAEWPFGTRGAPVWHLHESIERLLTLCQNYPRVCLGSSGEYASVGNDRWHARMRAAMAAVCVDGTPPVWLHMLRGLALSGSEYPFASADSTNIARNHSRQARRGETITRLVHRLDAIQCPAGWSV